MKQFVTMINLALFFVFFVAFGTSSPVPSDTAAEGKSLDVASQQASPLAATVGSTGDLDTANTFGIGLYGLGGGYGGYGHGGYYGGHGRGYGYPYGGYGYGRYYGGYGGYGGFW